MDYKQIKRLLALLKAQKEMPDREQDFEVPEGFIESFESQPHFRGWINYHVTWDVTREDPWTVVPRKRSLVAEWHEELMRVVPLVNPDGTIMDPKDGSQAFIQ